LTPNDPRVTNLILLYVRKLLCKLILLAQWLLRRFGKIFSKKKKWFSLWRHPTPGDNDFNLNLHFIRKLSFKFELFWPNSSRVGFWRGTTSHFPQKSWINENFHIAIWLLKIQTAKVTKFWKLHVHLVHQNWYHMSFYILHFNPWVEASAGGLQVPGFPQPSG
jgi:hypothetical protein